MSDLSSFSATAGRLGPALETRFSVAGTRGEIEGIAAGYGDHLIDSHGDTIAPGAFAASLQHHKAAGTAVIMLWAHSQEEPIGIWDDVKETASGLLVRGRINLETQRGREAVALLKQGAFKGLSIGFQLRAADRRKDGGRRITQADLWEVSLVAMPSRPEARVAEIKSARDLETILRAGGLPRAAATKAAAGGFPALTKPGATPATLSALAKILRSTADKL